MVEKFLSTENFRRPFLRKFQFYWESSLGQGPVLGARTISKNGDCLLDGTTCHYGRDKKINVASQD